MLLLQSDLLKAVWFMIYPAVEMARGRVPSEAAFCQASGFFLALGIEACDMAVLLIAIHTALNICRRRGNNGLYPYRKVAFAVYIGVPILLAGLAFRDRPAFANSGEYCYLPLRPKWTRRALSWIPRYVIFGVILIMYAWIYLHVRFVTMQFDASTTPARCSGPSSPGTSEARHTATVPPLPPIQRHGLIPSPMPSIAGSGDGSKRRTSLASILGNRFSRRTSASTQHVTRPNRPTLRWKLPSFKRATSMELNHQTNAETFHRRASSASSRLVPSVTKLGRGVKWKRSNFGHDANDSNSDSDGSSPSAIASGVREPRRHTAPCIIPLNAVDNELEEYRRSYSTSRNRLHERQTAHASTWSQLGIDVVDHQDHPRPSSQEESADAFRSKEMSPKMSPVVDEAHAALNLFSVASTPGQSLWNRQMTSFSRPTTKPPSVTSMLAVLQSGPQGSRESSSAFLSPAALEETGMAETREALRRQILQLLVYPLVYLAVWTCPFVSHLLGGRDIPFPLLVASLFSLSIQGAADALVFSLREKPWRQIQRDREDNGNRQLRVWWRGPHDSQTPRIGRTPDERLVDERVARRRLHEELEQRRSERNESERRVTGGKAMDWWDYRMGESY